MTAIPDLILPNLDGPAGSAAAPVGSSSELRLDAPEAGNKGVADKGNGKEFGELLNTRIVKKETGKEGNFDASKNSETETGEESADVLAADLKAGNSLPATETTSTNKGKGIGVTLVADPLLAKATTEAMVEDGVIEGDAATRLASSSNHSETLRSAGKSGITRPSGEEIAALRSSARGPVEGAGPVDNKPAPIAFKQADPAANAQGRVPFSSDGETGQNIGSAATKPNSTVGQAADSIAKPVSPGTQNPLASSQQVSQDPLTQARFTAPIRSDDIPISVNLNADRSLDSQTPKGLPASGEVEDFIPETVRQLQSAPSDLTSKPNRPAGGQRLDSLIQADEATAEIAALGGKQLPDGGKPLPSVLLQTPAQYAPGLSGRTDLMTRSVGNSGQRSLGKGIGKGVGKDIGEVSGLGKIAQVNNQLPMAELFGKMVSQVQPTASVETGLHTQTSTTDTQPTGLLAQHFAGVDKASSARTAAPLAGVEGSTTFSLQLQPGSQEMSAQLGSRIRWMSNLNISSAEVKLYPAELGTLEIMITAEDDQARVNFITSTSAAKEMIESSLPRLRELLGQSGLLLEQGDVTHRDLSQNNPESTTPVIESPAVESLETEALEKVMPMYQRSASDSQIDHFA